MSTRFSRKDFVSNQEVRWCPGCGDYSILAQMKKVLASLSIPREKVVVVSGIGCTGRIAGYIRLDSFHTTHGRPIPFATGLKLAQPELNVNVLSGDGDLAAIGGNHLIHAARRNIDLNVICINNFNYGMTGGQVGPTTPLEAKTTTSPFGRDVKDVGMPVKMAELLAALQTPAYITRQSVIKPKYINRAKKAIARAFAYQAESRCFSLVELVSNCPTNWGMTPLDSIGWVEDQLLAYYPLGDKKTPESGEEVS